jgi:cyclic-di-AMP phosphodiesterase PgpH
VIPFGQNRTRRLLVRENRPEVLNVWQSIKTPQIVWAISIAISFWLLAWGLASLRERMVRVRPDQYVDGDIVARVPFWSANPKYPADQNLPAQTHIAERTVLIERDSIVSPQQWKLLVEEQSAYLEDLIRNRPGARWLSLAGVGGMTLLVALALSTYVAAFQPRIVRNKYRALALAGLLLVTLLVAQLAGLSTQPLLVFGVAPTILVAMILAIVYDQRFAIGIGMLHGLLVTAGLNQGSGFFLTIWVGVMVVAFLLDEVRKRSKLVEVGLGAAVAMMLATAALDAMDTLPAWLIGRDCLYVGAAGLGVGFVVLGILPFIEKAFRITTSMTLLELADASHPLLRRLQIEAPGTYNHSLQVATLAEAAAEVVGASSLLCRVGSYYHDIGKVHKADYFCENELGGPNRHLNLTPNVSLLIIIGHVKDGVAMAREYRLPRVIQNLIQQHHGTTLVEFFFHKAQKQRETRGEDEVEESQYRYAGPKPRTRETAIVMLADAVESAGRAMAEPTANRIETLVHDIVMNRLLDGQFDECNLTFGELEQVEKALAKMLLSVYHTRLPYPSQSPPLRVVQPPPEIRSA